ncbi:MAG: Gfo/Idh/MocA family oxidoreductase [Pseudomonadota bacterium]
MLGVALIGTGMVSGTYADALANLSGTVRLVGVLARSEASATAFAKRHAPLLGHVPTVYRSIDHLTADPDVDFAILATPPNERLDHVSALARAGKPILMEKPVERTLAAATELCEICEAAGVPLGIVLQHRARPSAQTLRDLVEEDGLGPLRAVEIAVPWWRDQAYYDAPGRGTYARDGGGVLISQAIHTLDLALQFTGPVAEVTALTATTGFHRMEAEDFVSAGLRFTSGAVGTLFATTASLPGRTEEITLHYEGGSARLHSNLLEVVRPNGQEESFGSQAATGAGADPMAFTSDWHRAVIADFVDSMETGRPPLASARSALPVHGVIEALERSGRTGAKVVLADGSADG